MKDNQEEPLEFSYKHFTTLQDKVKELVDKNEKLLTESFNMRRSYMQEVCLLKDSISLINSTTSVVLQEKYKQSLNVKYFDEMDGIDPKIVTLCNEKIRLIKAEAEEMINYREAKLIDLAKQIEIFNGLKPEAFALLDMPIDQLF